MSGLLFWFQPPVAKPRTDNSVDKRLSPTKRRNNNVKSPGKSLDEILDTGRKSQVFAGSRQNSNDIRKNTPKSVNSESESVQVSGTLI